ncbi:MAG: hypothetical protein ACYSR6_02960, partial [Planctomycetota bacterium]
MSKSSSSRIFTSLGSVIRKPEKKTGRGYTGSSIKAENKISSVTPAKLTRGSGSAGRAAQTSKRSGSTILRKSESIVVQPRKGTKVNRGGAGQTVKADKNTRATAKVKASRGSKSSVAVGQASKSTVGKVVKKADSIIIAQFEKKDELGRGRTGRKTVKPNNKTFAATKAKTSGGSKSNAGVSRASKSSVGKAQKKTDSIIIAQPAKKGRTSRGQTHQVTKANRKTSGSTVAKASRVSKSKGGSAKTGKSSGSKGVSRSKPAGSQRGSASKSSGKRSGTVIKADRKTTVATKKATRGGKSSVGSTKTAKRGGRIVSKSGSVVKQAEKRTRTNRGSTDAKKWGGSRSNGGKGLRKGSVFTRPAGEKSQHRRRAGRKVLDESRPVVSRSRKAIARRR